MAMFNDTIDTQRANRRLIRESMNAPLLSRDHELELARRWRTFGDEQALHELIKSYMRLVISTAGRFRNYGMPLGDLVQEGVVGLMQAAARFEPERDVRFSTYAAWWIRSAMQDYILRNWSVVRTGTTAAQKALFFNLRRLRAKIDDGSYGHLDDAGKSYIAGELQVAVEEVEAMEMRLMGGDQSLNATISPQGEDAWQDFLADERPSPEDIIGDAYEFAHPLAVARILAGGAQLARADHHPRAAAARGRQHAGGAGRTARDQQGAGAADRAPRPAEAQGGSDAARQGSGGDRPVHAWPPCEGTCWRAWTAPAGSRISSPP